MKSSLFEINAAVSLLYEVLSRRAIVLFKSLTTINLSRSLSGVSPLGYSSVCCQHFTYDDKLKYGSIFQKLEYVIVYNSLCIK